MTTPDTQGLVTVIKGSKVVMKIFAECGGNNTQKLSEAISAAWPLTAEQAHKLASQNNFGCPNCLVVMTEKEAIFKAPHLDDVFRLTFNKPKKNPRHKPGQRTEYACVDIAKLPPKVTIACEICGIPHRVFHDGGVQSLRIAQIDGIHDGSIGVILPGKWDFGKIKNTEILTITSGRVKINGRECWAEPGHDTRLVEAGSQLIYEAEQIASYVCIFV